MKTRNNNNGPFLRNLFLKEERIVEIALMHLNGCRLMPETPGPVAIEKFCDRNWGFPEDYQELEADVMGRTAFTCEGFARIEINALLAEDGSPNGVRRVRSTLAHEIGHGILHEALFMEKLVAERDQPVLFGGPEPGGEKEPSAIVCRNSDIFGTPIQSKWWEVQANKFMAAILMPEPVFLQVARPALEEYDNTTPAVLNHFLHQAAIDQVAEAFNVSKSMARIAVDKHIAKIKAEVNAGVLW